MSGCFVSDIQNRAADNSCMSNIQQGLEQNLLTAC